MLQQLLELGQTVVGLDNFSTGYHRNLDDVHQIVGDTAWSRFSFVEGTIANLETCQRSCQGVEFVLHQAALGSVPRSIEDPLSSHESNVTGFVNMLTASRAAGVERVVFASSSAVYGDHPGLPKVEEQIGEPLSPYALTKYANELYASVFARCYGMQTIGLRYFNVFGPRQDPNGAYAAVIPKWIGQLLKGEECEVYGDGNTSRDFTFVANVVQANLLAAVVDNRDAVNTVYNIACSHRTTLKQLYDDIQDAVIRSASNLTRKPCCFSGFRAGDIQHSVADISKAQRLLRFNPQATLQEGLRETVASFYSCRSDTEGRISRPAA